MPELYEVPLPVMIGASRVQPDIRQDGPPSKKYPYLRDLAASPAKITIEIDTETQRVVGLIRGVTNGIGSDSPKLNLLVERHRLGGRTESKPYSLAFTKIVAFRVLKVEVDSLPAVV